jgi:hypothetical protein
MASKSCKSTCHSLGTLATVAVIVVFGGCALSKDDNRPGEVFNRIGGHSGQTIEPKRCLLKVAMLIRPFADPAIHDALWRVADEQIVLPATRRAWEANGLRLGRIIGALPGELEAVLKDPTPKNNASVTTFILEDGDSSPIRLSDPVDEASLLLNRENRIFGRDYRDASGFMRVTPRQEGTTSVALRLVPEIQHGPIQRFFQPQPSALAVAPHQFQMTTGQQEDTMRELAATVVLDPGHVAVIGCRTEQKRSLGTFMLTQAVARSDQRLEKIILIWASRNLEGYGPNDGRDVTTDRPKLLNRLLGPLPKTTASRPPAPEPEIPRLAVTTLPTEGSSTIRKAATTPTQAKPKTLPPPQYDPGMSSPADTTSPARTPQSP